MQSLGKMALVFAGVAAASLSIAEAQVTPPKPREQQQPEPPENRFGLPMEGWVVVRYTVKADGTTADVAAIDHMPPQLSDKIATKAVEEWTFEPAMDGGTAIDWHNNESVIVFDAEEIPATPSQFFIQAYREADELVRAGDHDKALKSNERMQLMGMSRLVEIGLAQMQNAVINIQLGDLHAAYRALQRATDPRIPMLANDDLKVALQYRNVLELQLGDAVAAMDTFARRNAIEPVPETDQVATAIASIREALKGDGAIVIRAQLADGRWRHVPSRRTFAISDVAGDVKQIQVECDRKSTVLAYAADSEWTLPASWGGCTLAVEGRNGTDLRFYEFP